MKFILALLLACTITGCGPKMLPKPDTANQAAVEALVAYGLAGHIAGQYLALPVCTQPLTTVPCKTTAIADKVKAADNVAYNAAVAASNAAGDLVKADNARVKLDGLKQVNAEANGGKQ